MKPKNHILFGNGINIEFGGQEYSNAAIVNRAFDKNRLATIPQDVYTVEAVLWIEKLAIHMSDVVAGEYDQWAVFDRDKKCLQRLKKIYSLNVKAHEIGIEDYGFVQEMIFRKLKVQNPAKYQSAELFRRLLLDAIFNEGKIQELYTQYPRNMTQYLKEFDRIMTVNYDSNLQHFTTQPVQYLHGCFHVLEDVYDPISLRNQLADRPLDKTPVIEGFEHLFSNAIIDYSGDHKDWKLKEGVRANDAIEKFAQAFTDGSLSDSTLKEWDGSDDLTSRLSGAIRLKKDRPDLVFNQFNTIELLESIEGSVTIVGLSPYNDDHIIELFDENEQIKEVIYHYYHPPECDPIKTMFPNTSVELRSVKELWSNI